MRAGDALASVVHRTRCQQRDRAQVETKFTPAHGHARRVDQRRQDSEQHQFRCQLDTRQARVNASKMPAMTRRMEGVVLNRRAMIATTTSTAAATECLNRRCHESHGRMNVVVGLSQLR